MSDEKEIESFWKKAFSRVLCLQRQVVFSLQTIPFRDDHLSLVLWSSWVSRGTRENGRKLQKGAIDQKEGLGRTKRVII